MADTASAQDRQLPASERKLEKAREEGQVARSRDLGHFAAVAGGAGVVVAFAPAVAATLRDMFAASLRFDRASALDAQAMGDRLGRATLDWALAALPIGVVLIGVALVAAFAMGGIVWSWKPMAPKFEAIDPLQGFARLVSRRQIVDALKASLLAIVVCAIGGGWLAGHVGAMTDLLAMPLPAAIGSAASTLAGGVGLMIAALALFAAIDVPWQKRQHAIGLRMSHQEARQEHKELEGNTEVKSKVRARMRLVVMNPTHYAVALKYDEQAMGAPKVVAKGADLLALRIRDLAKDSKVPVLESPVLARALYAHAELDREIPARLFAAVAQVLAYVYQLRAGLAAAVPEVEVPADLDPHAAAAA